MGKGDKRTKRGKLFRGSNGKPTKLKPRAAPKPEAKPARAPKPPREQAAPAPTPTAEPPAA